MLYLTERSCNGVRTRDQPDDILGGDGTSFAVAGDPAATHDPDRIAKVEDLA